MSETIQTKRCTKCKQVKSFSEFHKNKTKKDGHYFRCKQCQNQDAKLYRQQHEAEYRRHCKQRQRQYRKTLQGYLRGVWDNMLHRCNNPKHHDYKYYGARGIKVKFASFDDFFDYVVNDLKANPRGLTIDRINNDGHYELGNIRFIIQAANNRNRRNPDGKAQKKTCEERG